jgi:glycosyltransferase involved in cell wall biosynthesis
MTPKNAVSVQSPRTRAAHPRRPLVLHVLPETASAGAETQAHYLLRGLRELNRWELQLAYFRAGIAHEQFRSLGIPMREVTARRPLSRDWKQRVRALHALYAEKRPAIVHAWLDEANLVAALAIRRWSDAKLVISQRCARGAYGNLPFWRWTLRAIRGRVDQAVANSEGGLDFLRGLGYSASKTCLIRNGVPADLSPRPLSEAQVQARARDQLGLHDHTPVVGFVGRPDKMKDLGMLFQAMNTVWQAVPDARLILIGPDAGGIRKLGLTVPERVTPMGWWRQPPDLMPAFDVLALSSWTEGHSNAVDEALVAGVPVATTGTGDHAEVVIRTGGRVVPVGRPDLLGAAIVELLRHPPERAQIRATATRLLDMGPVVDAMDSLYRDLVASS